MSAQHAVAAAIAESVIKERANDLQPVIKRALDEYGYGMVDTELLAKFLAVRLANEFLPLNGWTCSACATFNGEERMRLSACRACGLARR